MKKLWILGTLALLPVTLPAVAPAPAQAKAIRPSKIFITSQVQSDPILSPFKFKIESVGSGYNLRGTVRALAQKRRVGQIARRYADGRFVNNYVVVSPGVATDYDRSPKRLHPRDEFIESKIESDSVLRPFSFKVQTVGNGFELRGTVRTSAQGRRAGGHRTPLLQRSARHEPHHHQPERVIQRHSLTAEPHLPPDTVRRRTRLRFGSCASTMICLRPYKYL